MSKFGNDDGSNSNGPKDDQASLNGFRLDNSQSSWLMDRLGALDEEDKISMASAAQAQLTDVDVDERAVVVSPEIYSQQNYEGQGLGSHVDGGEVGHVRQELTRNSARDGDFETEQHLMSSGDDGSYDPRRSGGHNQGFQGQGQGPKGRVPQTQVPQTQVPQTRVPHEQAPRTQVPHSQVVPGHPAHSQAGQRHVPASSEQGQDARQRPEVESSDLLQKKIENLEAQLAEISDITDEQRGDFVHTSAQPMEQLPVTTHLNEGLVNEGQVSEGQAFREQGDIYEEAAYSEGGAEAYGQQAPQAGYGQSQDQGFNEQRFAPQNHMPQGQVGQVGQQPHVQQGYMQPAHGQHDYEQQQNHQQHEYDGLPQFLAQDEQKKRMRPSPVTVIGLIGVLVVAGGIAYNYLGNSVSDIIKDDLSNSRTKQPVKLSDSSRNIVEAKIAPVVVAPPKVQSNLNAVPRINQGGDFVVAPVVGSSGDFIPFRVQLPEGLELDKAHLIVKGLPSGAKLNAGGKVDGQWKVSALDVSGLELSVSSGDVGEFVFDVDLITGPSGEIVSTKVKASFSSNIETVREEDGVDSHTPPDNEFSDKLPAISEVETDAGAKSIVNKGPRIMDRNLEAKWLERGNRLLGAGDVSAARLAFSHLADQGSGRAALAMGKTFDPNQLGAKESSGIKTDRKRALFWYQRALSLGNEDARGPLGQLERN